MPKVNIDPVLTLTGPGIKITVDFTHTEIDTLRKADFSVETISGLLGAHFNPAVGAVVFELVRIRRQELIDNDKGLGSRLIHTSAPLNHSTDIEPIEPPRPPPEPSGKPPGGR